MLATMHAIVLIAGNAPLAFAAVPPVGQALPASLVRDAAPASATAPAAAGPSTTDAPPLDSTAPDTRAAPTAGDTASDGAIVVTGRAPSRSDPLEAVNVKSFEAVQAVDGAVIAPIAHAYERRIPSPARSGIRNVLSNLHEPVVAVNFLLQHRVGKSLETVGRFAINSTIGVAGLFDVAKRAPINLSHRDNGFADTMGFYGVKPGAYMYLPLIGATTVRDLAGYALDHAVLPLAVGRPFNKLAYTVPSGALSALDKRVERDAELRKINESADPYLSMREFYLKGRQAEIEGLHTKRRKP